VLAPELTIVTNIGLEHTAILGATRAEIAAEKAGIAKTGVPLVSGVGPPGDEAADVVAACAEAVGAPLYRVAEAEGGAVVDRNAALAEAALDELGRRFPALACEGRGAGAWLLGEATRAAARLPGRQELVTRRGVPVVLDGAHVASSLEAVLRERKGDSRLAEGGIAVLALGKDKDAPALLKVLQGRVDSVICTTAGTGPYRAPEELVEGARRIGMTAHAVADPREAYNQALEAARGGGWVLVTGSLHLVGILRSRS